MSLTRTLCDMPGRLIVLIALVLAACGGGDPDDTATTIAFPPGEVFPEGVAVDKETGALFAGSTADGTIYRTTPGPDAGAFEPFLPAGGDGRDEVVGLKVRDGLLFAAGRNLGRVFVYDAQDGDLVRVLEAPPAEDSLLNDLTFAGDAAFVTDSFRPVLFRIPLSGGEVGDLTPWLDLDDTPITYEGGFNLNGISASDDGRVLLTVQSNTGVLWRIDVATQEVTAVDLGGGSLTTGDGLLLDGTTLYAVRNEPGLVARIELSDDLRQGEVVEEITDDSFAFPTTIAEQGGRIYVVNSQLDRPPSSTDTPFTVSVLPPR